MRVGEGEGKGKDHDLQESRAKYKNLTKNYKNYEEIL